MLLAAVLSCASSFFEFSALGSNIRSTKTQKIPLISRKTCKKFNLLGMGAG